MTHETFVHFWAAKYNPNPIEICRLDDRLYLVEFYEQYRPGNVNDGLFAPIVDEGLRVLEELINQRTDLIKFDVVANVGAASVNLFKDVDPVMFMFVLTKAVYIYAIGSKKDDEIPDFFKPETKDLILALREELPSEATVAELERLILDLDQFEIAPQGDSAKSIFDRLRNAAVEELQNSLLTTRCWQRVIERFPG